MVIISPKGFASRLGLLRLFMCDGKNDGGRFCTMKMRPVSETFFNHFFGLNASGSTWCLLLPIWYCSLVQMV